MPARVKREHDERHQEKLDQAAAAQLEEDTSTLLSLWKRFGKGAARWADEEWEWQEPDWDADPETWPALAKLLYLWQAADEQFSHWQLKTHINRPEWCRQCRGSEMPDGYRQRVCVWHSNYIATVQRMATDLGWREAPALKQETEKTG